jgi:hypothetical protein
MVADRKFHYWRLSKQVPTVFYNQAINNDWKALPSAKREQYNAESGRQLREKWAYIDAYRKAKAGQ